MTWKVINHRTIMQLNIQQYLQKNQIVENLGVELLNILAFIWFILCTKISVNIE